MGGQSAAGGTAGVNTGQSAALAAVRARNYRLVQIDSVFIGIVNAAGTFLPVFLLRLGGSPGDIGLLTALPALTAFVLAIPFGRWLQPRRNMVPWYSRLRLVAWSSYAVLALIPAALPREQAIPVMLAVWALASLPSTAALVAFPMVMDGAAGPGGRFDLLGRRWAIAGVTGAIAVAVGGQFLSATPFPANYEILLLIVALAGLGSYLQSSRIVIPDHPVVAASTRAPARARLGALWGLVVANRSFVRFELRSLVYTAAIGLSFPILPLFYVHEVGAPDAWIGIIAGAGSAGSVLGYLTVRQLARRRSGSTTLLASMFVAALGPVVLSAISFLPALAVIAFAWGIAGAGAQLAMFDQLMRRIPAEHGVTFSSVDQSLQNLAIVIAPNLGGALVLALGVRQSLLVLAGVSFAAFILFAVEARAPRGSGSEAPATAKLPTPDAPEPGLLEAGDGA